MFFKRSSSSRAQLSDAELISQYKETGDAAYVGELFERYSALIYGICRKYIDDREACKDASMEVFEYLLTELKKYEIQQFKHWLGRATRNFCLMRIRKDTSRNQRMEDFKKSETPLMEEAQLPHLDSADTKEASLRSLELALQGLKEEQKICVELFFLQDKSYQEVADLTGFSLNQVKSHIQNGKRNLKIQMESSSHE
jgi:RNA polymerase sigma-70 factor (ECF subfamily)